MRSHVVCATDAPGDLLFTVDTYVCIIAAHYQQWDSNLGDYALPGVQYGQHYAFDPKNSSRLRLASLRKQRRHFRGSKTVQNMYD